MKTSTVAHSTSRTRMAVWTWMEATTSTTRTKMVVPAWAPLDIKAGSRAGSRARAHRFNMARRRLTRRVGTHTAHKPDTLRVVRQPSPRRARVEGARPGLLRRMSNGWRHVVGVPDMGGHEARRGAGAEDSDRF